MSLYSFLLQGRPGPLVALIVIILIVGCCLTEMVSNVARAFYKINAEEDREEEE